MLFSMAFPAVCPTSTQIQAIPARFRIVNRLSHSKKEQLGDMLWCFVPMTLLEIVSGEISWIPRLRVEEGCPEITSTDYSCFLVTLPPLMALKESLEAFRIN